MRLPLPMRFRQLTADVQRRIKAIAYDFATAARQRRQRLRALIRSLPDAMRRLIHAGRGGRAHDRGRDNDESGGGGVGFGRRGGNAENELRV